MKLPCLLQPRILKLAVKSLLSRPFTTRFPAEPYEAPESFRGRPRFSEEECIGCGACAEVCPSKCIDVMDDTKAQPPRRRLVQHVDACICCGQCERYCTSEKGIRLTNEYEFVGFSPQDFEEKIAKDLLLCESCGCTIAPVDQMRWIARRLGPLLYTNPTVMLVSNREFAVVDPGVRAEDGETDRSQRLRVQCPKCRRRAALIVWPDPPARWTLSAVASAAACAAGYASWESGTALAATTGSGRWSSIV